MVSYDSEIKQLLADSISAKNKLLSEQNQISQIAKAIDAIADAYKKNNKLLIFGNGGSAADAQHLAAEFVNKFKLDRKPLPAIALTTDTSIITAVGNDSAFDYIFARQIRALGRGGDIAIAITTSDASYELHGHSADIMQGLIAAKEQGLTTIGLYSEKSKDVLKYTDIPIQVPARDTPRIQEAHLIIEHIICELVEKQLFG